MARKGELESYIRECYEIIKGYEATVRETDRPEERSRARRTISEQWHLIDTYLNEFITLCEQQHYQVANEFIELAARFPQHSDRLQKLMLTQTTESLQQVLRNEGLGEPQQAAQTIAAAIPVNGPLLFSQGLCAGYPLTPAPAQYFVAQGFMPAREDLLQALESAFAEFKLRPYRIDEDILPGHILCKIAAKIQTTLFSVFNLTHDQNRNDYLALGIAIGLRRSFLLIKESDAQLSPLVQGLDHYNLHSYAALKKELNDQVRQYLLNIGRYQSVPPVSANVGATYTIAHGDWDMAADFALAVAESLAGNGLTPVLLGNDNRVVVELLTGANLAPQLINGTGQTLLDATMAAIATARLGIYRVDENCAPDTFLALGMAIGLNRPWLLISRKGQRLPACVRGLSGLEFNSFIELGNQLPRVMNRLLQG